VRTDPSAPPRLIQTLRPLIPSASRGIRVWIHPRIGSARDKQPDGEKGLGSYLKIT